MRISVATKIFLGFALVIVAFSSACIYTIYRMNDLREGLTVMWEGVEPVRNRLKDLARQLLALEQFLELKRPGDAEYLNELLPTPFVRLRAIEMRLSALAASDDAAETDRQLLGDVAATLRSFRLGNEVVAVLDKEGLSRLGPGEERSSEAVYERLIRRVIKLANEGRLKKSSPESRATTRALRAVDKAANEAHRELHRRIRALPERAASEERAATIAVILTASGALAVSVIMLIVSVLTLAPIKQLRGGARRIAEGHYSERVRIGRSDEIGQLGREFNTMAQAIEARDEELKSQREALLRADRLATIGKLAAQITHEVRNPLSSIGLNAELLEEELEELEDRQEASALLAAISEEVQRLKSITEEYLRFARLPRPDLAPVDVGALLLQFLSFVEYELADAGVEVAARQVVATADGGPPPISADADQLRQALLNIARNAIDALSDVPSPRRLEVELTSTGEQMLRICISDNGPGIDEELRDRIFEPFVTGKSGGTGLGLALTQQIIEEHNGRIQAVSPWVEGRGTAFIIELPIT